MELFEARWALRRFAGGKKLNPPTISDLYLAGYLGIDLQLSRKKLRPTVITEKGKRVLET